MILELFQQTDNNKNGFQKTFSELGGTIGRAKENDLVLDCPNKIISRKHAKIYSREDDFYIEDISSNGVFVNSTDQPIGKNSCQIIHSNDEIKIGSYCFKALIHKENKTESEDAPAILSDFNPLNIDIDNQSIEPNTNNIATQLNDPFDNIVKANTSNHINNPLGNIGDNFESSPQSIAKQIVNDEIKPLKINNLKDKKQIIPDNWDKTDNIETLEHATIDQCLSQQTITDTSAETDLGLNQSNSNNTEPTLAESVVESTIEESNKLDPSQAAAIQYLLSGMGVNEEINIDNISPEQYYHLGKAVKIAISGAIVNKKWLEKSCSELCIDKQAIKRNQSGQFDYHSAEELLNKLLTEKQGKHSINTKLANLYRDTIEDQKNIFNFIKDLITNLESDINPLQLEIEMIEKENMNLKRSNGVEDLKGRLNPYKKKWEFMIENWSEFYQKSIIDIRRSFERQMVLSLVRRKSRDSNE